MYPLVESIKLQDGEFKHLKWHQERLEDAFQKYYHKKCGYNLSEVLVTSENWDKGLFKCRFLYACEAYKIEILPYSLREFFSLKIVQDNKIDYSLKYTDRSAIEKLKLQKGDCDDILIVKDGFICDTSFSNIAFFDGQEWVTPDTFLLKGTQRSRLLSEGKIIEDQIKPSDLQKYSHFKLLNAMLDFETQSAISISRIKG